MFNNLVVLSQSNQKYYMDMIKWLFMAGLPLWVMVFGGLIMWAFGYQGYEMDGSSGEAFGMFVVIIGIILFVARIFKIVRSWILGK